MVIKGTEVVNHVYPTQWDHSLRTRVYFIYKMVW